MPRTDGCRLAKHTRHRCRTDGCDDASDGRVRDDARYPLLQSIQIAAIIALTAKAMQGDRSLSKGASDYITKPVDTEQLFSLLRVWLYQ